MRKPLTLLSGTSFDDVFVPSRLLKDNNVVIIAIGIGRLANFTQIEVIASEPLEKFSFRVESFTALTRITESLTERIKLCDVSLCTID